MSAAAIEALRELYDLEDITDDYPIPDFRRPNLKWQSLNGAWDFAFDDGNVGLDQSWQVDGLPRTSKRRIAVPFAFQWPASGVGDRAAHEVLWYETNFDDPRTDAERSAGERLVVRFGAVDYEAALWLDGVLVGSHAGGHVPFDVDLTDVVGLSWRRGAPGLHRLTVRVRDSPDDLTQPRGKQYWGPKPKDIFYTPSSGIWQSVWLEVLPASRMADGSGGTIIRATDAEYGNIHADIAILGKYRGYSVELSVGIGDFTIASVRQDVRNTGYANITVSVRFKEGDGMLPSSKATTHYLNRKNGKEIGIALWSPEEPFLYTLQATLYNESGQPVDKVTTTAGIRSLDWTSDHATFKLNGAPYFQALVLDQGYWPDAGLTAPTPLHHALDIDAAKSMGFNGCRKHQKVEDPYFLHLADRMGFIVWGEMANAYAFSARYVERFDAEWRAAVRRDINRPCVFAWTPVNESWGYDALGANRRQRDHLRSLYYATKALDPTRPVNENCGWEHVATDLLTFHDYAEAAALTATCASMGGVLGRKSGREIVVASNDGLGGAACAPGAPVICTEFGGVNIRPAEGAEARSDDWGYHTAEDPDDLLGRIRGLMTGIVAGKIVCGFVYTQL
jgi:beta-galactosidase/beta-glucuronidase